MENGECI